MNEKKYQINVKEEQKKENPMVNITWKDNGQIMAEITCYPEEVGIINELFEFIKKLDI